MIEIEDLTRKDSEGLLAELHFGHLGCSENGQPYVVPIHFAFEPPNLYLYTTDGKKSRIISENSKICLQAEDILSNEDWRSVIVLGDAVQVNEEEERQTALKMIAAVNPKMTPAVSVRWMDSWVKENIEVIYRIDISEITGRATVKRTRTDAPFANRPNNRGVN